MDIGGINSGYLAQASSSASDALSKTERDIKKDYSGQTDEEMLKACKQFEAYFIEQVLKEVEKTIPNEFEGTSSGKLVDFFKDSMLQDVAEDMQDKCRLGLAQQMYEQMKRNYGSRVTAEELEERAIETGASSVTEA